MVICGKAVSVEDDRNYFWYGSVGQGDWSIDPEDTGTDKMIIMESSFSNEEQELFPASDGGRRGVDDGI